MELPKTKSKLKKNIIDYIFTIYGEPKAGKTTLASNFEKALFIMTEPGAKLQKIYGGEKVHKNWNEIRDTVQRICTEEHDFKTIVIDTVDNASSFCSDYVLKKKKIEHESDEGFGKGWTAVKKEFQSVINALANRGYGLVFISHSKQSEREFRGIKRPYTDNSLSSGAKAYVNGLSDFILYAFVDDDGKRYLRTKATLNINAGSRSGNLDDVLPMDFKTLKGQIEK